MNDTSPPDPVNLIVLTAEIVSAFVASNRIDRSEIAELIASTHVALGQLGTEGPKAAETLVPPVSIKKSVTPDYLISLEDGKRYKSMKRHLAGRGLTPATYRTKWGLSPDYPMVAPNYAKQRSDLAKALGLGQQRKAAAPASEADASPKVLAKRGRKPKVQGQPE